MKRTEREKLSLRVWSFLIAVPMAACTTVAETKPTSAMPAETVFERETKMVATYGASFAGSSSYPAFGEGWKVYAFSADEEVVGAERVRYWRIRSVADRGAGATATVEYDSLTCPAVVEIIDEAVAFRPPAIDAPSRMSKPSVDSDPFPGGRYGPGVDGTLYRLWGRAQSNPAWNSENIRFSQEVLDGPIAKWHDGLDARLAKCPALKRSGPAY